MSNGSLAETPVSKIPDGELEAFGTKILFVLSYGLALLAPTLITILFSSLTAGRGLLEPVPTWNDELVYWHGIGTFREAGFSGGYYTFDEKPARAAFTHFDAHGPAFFVIMGMVAALLNWTPGSMVILNLLMLSGAIAVFLIAVRPSPSRALLAAAVFGSFWAMPLFVPIMMQESFHQAVGILAGTALFCVLKAGSRTDRLWRAVLLFGLVVVSLVRPLWMFLLPPVVLCLRERWTIGRSIVAGIGVVSLTAVVFATFSWWSAPYPNTFNGWVLGLLIHQPMRGIGEILAHVLQAFELMGRGNVIEISCRQQVFLLIALAGISLFVRGRRWSGLESREAIVHLLNLGVLTLFLFSLHDIFDLRDFRTFAPHLLCSMVLLVGMNRTGPVVLLVVLNLTVASSALSLFRDFHTERYTLPLREVDDFVVTTAPYLRFTADGDGWCNTVLTQAVYRYKFPHGIQGIPPGMGFSIILDESHLQYPLRSKYLLINDETAFKIVQKQRIELLTSVGPQKLYLNNDSPCIGAADNG